MSISLITDLNFANQYCLVPEEEDEEINQQIAEIANSLLNISKRSINIDQNNKEIYNKISELKIIHTEISIELDKNIKQTNSIKNALIRNTQNLNSLKNILIIDRSLNKKYPCLLKIQDILHVATAYSNISSLLSLSSTSKYWNRFCNTEEAWKNISQQLVDEYTKNTFNNHIFKHINYIDYLRDGYWTDFIKIAVKCGIVLLPIISSINSVIYYRNIPKDAVKILVRWIDEDGYENYAEEYDHPEYEKYSQIAGISVLSGIFASACLVVDLINHINNLDKSINRLQDLDEINREKIGQVSPLIQYISPRFIDWKINRVNKNKENLENFGIKIKNKIK